MNYFQDLSYYFDLNLIREIQLNYYQLALPFFLIFVYYFLNKKDERISRKRIKQLEENLLRNNAILDALTLSIAKMTEQHLKTGLFLDSIEDRINKLEESVDTFHYKDYEKFKELTMENFNFIHSELKILHDTTFLPDEQDDEQDSDYEP